MKTGYRIYPTLKKVSDDANEYPLDANNMRAGTPSPPGSGLPQSKIPLDPSDPRYRVLSDVCGTYTFTKTKDFQRSCTPPSVGTIITYAEDYTSEISLEDAQNQANADQTGFDSRGQANAQTMGICNDPLPSDAVGIVVIDLYDEATMDVCCYIDNPEVVVYRQPAYIGMNFIPNDGTSAANCWLLSSDAVNNGTSLKRRFEVNIARLINTYPSSAQFFIKVRGRNTVATLLGGQYALKGAEVGNMVMTGTPGFYIPSTASTNNLSTQSFGGVNIPGGANGEIGVDTGVVLLTFTYNVAAKTLTLS